MRKKLLVLGAGRHQVDLIQRAEQIGIEVVAVDYYPNAPGKEFASHPELVDALDINRVLEVAIEHGVDGVMTSGTDQAVRTMASVAHELYLPSYISPEASVLATDKVVMSEAFESTGVRRPPSIEISALDDLRQINLDLPLVVKPADAQGQRATTLVRTVEAVSDAVAAALAESRSSRAIVEAFVPGHEVTASAWLSNGEVQLLAVTDRLTYNKPPALGVCVQHVFPSLHAAHRLEEVRDQVSRVALAYGMTTGPLYVQMIMGDDAVVVIEAGARIGGGHENVLIPAVTGVEVTDHLIELALTGSSNPVTYDMAGIDHYTHGLVNFLLARPGQVTQMNGLDAILSSDAVEAAGYYIAEGHVQGEIVNSLGRVGYFVATGPTRETLALEARRAFSALSVLDAAGREMLFWPESQFMNG